MSSMNVPTNTTGISLIVPVLNEVMHVQRTIESLLHQDASPLIAEYLFIDGGSRDGTCDIIRRYARAYESIRLLKNPHRTTPFALNIGLYAARGDYIAILGAHASYSPDYIRICWEELHAHNAVGCSGRLLTLPANETLGARLAAWCMGNRFASSGRSSRTHLHGFANTIPFPVFRKQALIDVGGYDESLDRNQDNDMNERLRANGHRLYLTARTHAAYYARPGILSLLVHAYNTGKWNGKAMRGRRGGLYLHHFVPLAFVLAIIGALAFAVVCIRVKSSFFSLLSLAFLIAIHLLMGVFAGIATAIRQRTASALLLPAVILPFHLAYGTGTAVGLLDTRLSLQATRTQVVGRQ